MNGEKENRLLNKTKNVPTSMKILNLSLVQPLFPKYHFSRMCLSQHLSRKKVKSATVQMFISLKLKH